MLDQQLTRGSPTPRRLGLYRLGLVTYVGLAALVVSTSIQTPSAPEQLSRAAFLALMTLALGRAVVRLERGTLNLTAIPNMVAALQLTPVLAGLIGLVSGASAARRDHPGSYLQIAGYSLWVAFPALLRLGFNQSHAPALVSALAVILALSIGNIMITGLNLAAVSGEPVIDVWRRGVTPLMLLSFGYFAVAALLIDHVLDGSFGGYCYAALVAGLSLAFADTVGGRRVRRLLEAQLTDADRYVIFTRVAEGVVHNVRNELTAVDGYLATVEDARLDPVIRRDIASARKATAEAIESLRSLSAGATPTVAVAAKAVDLNELLLAAVGQVDSALRRHRINLQLKPSHEVLSCRADPSLVRDVFTNILLNAIEAVAIGGHITLRSGRRGPRWVYVTISDSGPGIAERDRERLFEPHFTTKSQGSGMGLFVSYGVIREHRGEILYEGVEGSGAVFTVLLPHAMTE